jgi:hypothetical protein
VDTDLIVRTFEALLNAGALISTVVAAFFIMLSGFQYLTAGGSLRRRRVGEKRVLQRDDRLRHRHPVQGRRQPGGWALCAPTQALGPALPVLG